MPPLLSFLLAALAFVSVHKATQAVAEIHIDAALSMPAVGTAVTTPTLVVAVMTTPTAVEAPTAVATTTAVPAA